jgi:hypothetical protein
VKKFLIHLAGSVLVGLILSIGLSFLIPGWTRSDMISVLALVIAVWAATSFYLASTPKDQSSRKLPGNPNQRHWDNSAGSVHFTLEKKSSSTFDLFVRNNGKVEIKEVTFNTTPFGNTPIPTFTQKPSKPLPFLRPWDKVTIAQGKFDPSKGISFVIEAFWKDPSGRSQSQKKTMDYR